MNPDGRWHVWVERDPTARLSRGSNLVCRFCGTGGYYHGDDWRFMEPSTFHDLIVRDGAVDWRKEDFRG